MNQVSLFDSPAPAAPTTSSPVSLGDRITWTSGGEQRSGRVVFSGPRMGFYAWSEYWLTRQDYDEFMKFAGLRRGSADAWLHQPGTLLIARNREGWWPIGSGVAMSKVEASS